MRIVIISILLFGLWSCNKDKLKKEKEVLIGEWKWKDGTYYYNLCQQGPSSQMDIDPVVLNVNYTVQFIQEGRIRIYKDGSLLKKGIIHFDSWKSSTGLTNGYVFKILLDKDIEKYISGTVNQDTLRLGSSYFFENTTSCHSEYVTCCQYECYYTRQ